MAKYSADICGKIGFSSPGGSPDQPQAVMSFAAPAVDSLDQCRFQATIDPGPALDLFSLLKLFIAAIDLGDSGLAGLLPTVDLQRMDFFQDNVGWHYSCAADIQWPAPFGIGRGLAVSLDDLTMIRPANAQTYTVYFHGSLASWNLDVYGCVANNKLVLLAADAKDSLSVSDLFDYFFGNGVSWPAGIVDVSFSQTRVYYSTETAPVLDFAPAGYLPLGNIQQGLNISTNVQISLADLAIPPLTVNASILTGSSQGLTIDAALQQPISIFSFLSITGSNYNAGPGFQLNTVTGVYEFDCGMLLGSTQLGTASLKVSNGQNGRQLDASLTPDPGMLNSLKITGGSQGPWTFTWTKPDGWRMDNIPFTALGDILKLEDFGKYLQQLASSGNCGQLAVNFLNTVMESQVVVKPSFSTILPAGYAGVSGAVCYILIDGYYKISCQGTNVISMDLPSLAISIDISGINNFDFGDIFSAIVANIGENMLAIVQQLWNDKADLSKFLLVFMGKQALQQLVGQMTCDLGSSLSDFLENLGDDALNTVSDCLSAASSALSSMLGGLTSPCNSSSGGGGGNNNDGGGGGTIGGLPVVLTAPAITPAVGYDRKELNFTIQNTNAQTIQGMEYWWQLLMGTGSGAYRALLQDVLISGTGQQPVACGIALDADTKPGGYYWFGAKCLAPASGFSVDSDFNSIGLYKFIGPTDVQLAFDQASNNFTASWAPEVPPPDNTSLVPAGYWVQLLYGPNDNRTMVQQWLVKGDQLSFPMPVQAQLARLPLFSRLLNLIRKPAAGSPLSGSKGSPIPSGDIPGSARSIGATPGTAFTDPAPGAAWQVRVVSKAVYDLNVYISAPAAIYTCDSAAIASTTVVVQEGIGVMQIGTDFIIY